MVVGRSVVIREGSSDPLHVWYYGGVFEVGGSNGDNSGLSKSKMAARLPAAILEKFKWRYLGGGSSDLLRVWFWDGVFGIGGLNGANSGLTKFNRCVRENNARGVIRLVTI